MYLAHAASLFLAPLSIAVAVLTVAIGLRLVHGDMLGPQQLEGDPLALELLMHLKVIGFHKTRGLLLRREQQPFQLCFIRVFRQRPGEATSCCQVKVLADHPFGNTAGAGDLLVTEFGLVFEAHNIDDLAH